MADIVGKQEGGGNVGTFLPEIDSGVPISEIDLG